MWIGRHDWRSFLAGSKVSQDSELYFSKTNLKEKESFCMSEDLSRNLRQEVYDMLKGSYALH